LTFRIKEVVTYQWVRMLVVQLLSQELDDGHELVGGRDLEDILLHDWGISDSSKPDNDYQRRNKMVEETVRA